MESPKRRASRGLKTTKTVFLGSTIIGVYFFGFFLGGFHTFRSRIFHRFRTMYINSTCRKWGLWDETASRWNLERNPNRQGVMTPECKFKIGKNSQKFAVQIRIHSISSRKNFIPEKFHSKNNEILKRFPPENFIPPDSQQAGANFEFYESETLQNS